MRNHPELTRLAHRLANAAQEHDWVVHEARSEADRYNTMGEATDSYTYLLARDTKLRLIEDLQRSIRTIAGAVAAYERAVSHIIDANLISGRTVAPTCHVDGCDKLVEHFRRVDGSIGYRAHGKCAGCRTADRRRRGELV